MRTAFIEFKCNGATVIQLEFGGKVTQIICPNLVQPTVCSIDNNQCCCTDRNVRFLKERSQK